MKLRASVRPRLRAYADNRVAGDKRRPRPDKIAQQLTEKSTVMPENTPA
jgi:hypothetical protein